jgi:putative FmdB family regulatory protein
MPIYEYECTSCGNITEVIQKFSDQPLTRCENCSGRLNKLVSQTSFQLKGTGWYVTDYAKKNKKAPPETPQKKKDTTTEKTVASGSETTSKASDK